jgi:hypothetical protein
VFYLSTYGHFCANWIISLKEKKRKETLPTNPPFCRREGSGKAGLETFK